MPRLYFLPDDKQIETKPGHKHSGGVTRSRYSSYEGLRWECALLYLQSSDSRGSQVLYSAERQRTGARRTIAL